MASSKTRKPALAVTRNRLRKDRSGGRIIDSENNKPIAARPQGRIALSTARDVVHSVAIYDGRLYLGDVAELRNGQYRALASDDNLLGVFDKRALAERAILLSRIGRVVTQ